MRHLLTPTTDAPHRIDGSFPALCSALSQFLFWLLVLIFATLDLSSRFLLFALRLAIHLVSGFLFYLIIAILVIGAVILMLGFHSASVITGNFP
jgi:hypothetical protein